MRLGPLIVAVVLVVGCGGGNGAAGNDEYSRGLGSALRGVAAPSALDSASLAALADDYGQAADDAPG